MSQHIGNHLKNIPRSRTAPPHMGERTISFGALPCCCRFIDSCLTHAGLVRLCLVSLISPQHSFSAQVFSKPGKYGQYLQVILHLRVHFAKL